LSLLIELIQFSVAKPKHSACTVSTFLCNKFDLMLSATKVPPLNQRQNTDILHLITWRQLLYLYLR
jgi:hypothetical protein